MQGKALIDWHAFGPDVKSTAFREDAECKSLGMPAGIGDLNEYTACFDQLNTPRSELSFAAATCATPAEPANRDNRFGPVSTCR